MFTLDDDELAAILTQEGAGRIADLQLNSSQARAVALIALLFSSHDGLVIGDLRDENIFGSERSFQRLRKEINNTWKKVTGRELFDEVNGKGEKSRRGSFRRLRLRPAAKLNIDRDASAYVLAGATILQTIMGDTLVAKYWKKLGVSLTDQLSSSEKNTYKAATKKLYLLPRTPVKMASHQTVFAKIQQAVFGQYLIRIDYESGKKTAVVKPLSILIWNELFYLVGRKRVDGKEEPEKNWRIDRIDKVVAVPNSNFDYPKVYNPAFLRKRIFGFKQQSGQPPVRVTLLVENNTAAFEYLSSRQFSAGDFWMSVGGGRHRFKFDAANMDEVMTLLLGLGAAVVVESPQQLRLQIQQEAAKIVTAYEANHGSSP